MTNIQHSSVKKVVLLCDFFSSFGGTENYNAALARGLRDRGIEVRIYVGERPRLVSWRTQLTDEGFFFKTPETFHEDLTTNAIEKVFIADIVDEINEWKPDIIQVHPFRKMAIQWLENEHADHTIPMIATEWTVPNKNAAHWFEANSIEYINRVRAYIATCHAITKGIKEYHQYQGEIVEIPHIIPHIPMSILPHTSDTLGSVGCISRLSTEKGLVFLIGAWIQVVAKFPLQKLYIYGHGPDQESLELLRDCLGLHDSIIFAGTYEPGTVQEIAERHSIFVQPSLFESIPTSIIELMTSGRVVVVSDVGGVSELVRDNQNGIIVKPGSTDEIAEAIITLLSSRTMVESFSEVAYQDSQRVYDYEKTMNQIIELYEKIIN
ncbi:MAG: glycosyltransferase family 4 protein [Candidatus Microsaccharimonas sp.]